MFYLFLFGKLLALSLPRGFAYTIARRLALLYYRRAKKDREAIGYNLSVLNCGNDQLERYVRQVFVNFAYYLVDFFRFSKLTPGFIKRYVRVSGLEHLDEAFAQKLPAIAFSAHLGNYELAGAVTSLLGYPVAAVALPHHDSRITSFFNSQRERVGIKVISTGQAIKGCISALNSGYLLAMLGDRDFSRHGVAMKVFFRRAVLPRGAAYFACKTGASIIPGFLIRENTFYYHLRFEKPVWVKPSAETDERALIASCVPVLEAYISKYPDQWYLFEKYWLPEGEADGNGTPAGGRRLRGPYNVE